jgi:TRAP-type C4-dicarboxylate transport system permease small subunit
VVVESAPPRGGLCQSAAVNKPCHPLLGEHEMNDSSHHVDISRFVRNTVCFGNALEKIEYFLGSVAIVVFFTAVFLNVLFRELFTPLNWAEEISRFGYMWSIFLGAGVALRHSRHFTIDILVAKITGKKRKLLDLFHNLIILVFSVYVFYYGVLFAIMSIKRISFPSGIPLVYSSLSIPIGAIAMIVFVIESLILLKSGLTLDEARTAIAKERG